MRRQHDRVPEAKIGAAVLGVGIARNLLKID
jgi:hypothetical protein